MGTIVAVDIGGTHLRAALYEPENTSPLAHKRVDTDADLPGVYNRLQAVIESIWPHDQSVLAIGIASPGPLDPRTGHILKTPNIPEWRDFPLAPQLAAHFGVPAFLDNDARLAALGEWKFGAAKGHRDVLYLTLSTGVGGGVIEDGHLLHGYHGLGTELGHTMIDPDGPTCSCGFPGHVEAFSSGPAIVKYVLEQLDAGAKSCLKQNDHVTAEMIADAALQGDSLSISAYRRAGEYLGMGVASFLHAFDPSIVVFGGGVSLVGPMLFEPFQASLKKRVFHPRYLENLKIEIGALGDDAGLLGALALAKISIQT
jgi:glucokinase